MSRWPTLSPRHRGLLIASGSLCALLLWATSTLVIALAGLHRLIPQLDVARLPAWLWWFRADPQLARWFKVGALGSGLIIALMAVGVASNLRRPLHGRARFARGGEIRREGLRAPDGVLLGADDAGLLSFGGAEHVLLYAPTRSGKGVGVVIPNLLSWSGSAVVLDIKRENWAATAGFRAEHGQTVHLFDPLAADGATARYNPLAHIRRDDAVEVLDELQKIATMLFADDGAKADPFWAESARTGFIGVGAYVAETAALPFTLGQIFRELTQGAPKKRFPDLITQRARAGRPLSSECVSALTDFCAASDNTFSSVRQTITARMGLWLNPRLDAATAHSDFDLRDLRQAKITIYLAASPDNISRVAPLYSLFFQQLVDLNTRTLPAPTDTGRVLLLLDEFARLGTAPVLAHSFSFVAGYGLRILAVLQSPSQLRAAYGPDLAQEIISNCGVEVVFTPKELTIAKELSERLGYDTVDGLSRSRPAGLAKGGRSVTESDHRRALMLPQELLQLPRSRLLVLRAGLAPILGTKLVYWRDRAFTARLRSPPPVLPPSSAASAADLRALAVDVATIRADFQELRSQVVFRSMTPQEASGETPLGDDDISLALEDVDMAALPQGDLSDAEVRAVLADYVHRASNPGGSLSSAMEGAARDRTPEPTA